MKLIYSTILLFILLSLNSRAQQATIENIFMRGSITWLGIDFTKAKIIDNKLEPSKIKNEYIPAWNNMIFNKNDKLWMNVHRAVHKSDMYFYTKAVKEKNNAIKTDFTTPQSLDREEIQKAILAYDMGNQYGLGVVLFIDSFHKQRKSVNGKVAFIDIKSKKILMLKKVKGETGGWGIKAYYGNGINEMFLYMEKKWEDWNKREMILSY